MISLLPVVLIAGCDRGSTPAVQANASADNAASAEPPISPDEAVPTGPEVQPGKAAPDYSHAGEAMPTVGGTGGVEAANA